MGRLRRHFQLFRDVPPVWHGKKIGDGIEGLPSEWVGQKVGYRHGIVLWLNRALSRTPADRKAAERVGALINTLNYDTATRLASDNVIPDAVNANPGKTSPLYKSLKEIAPHYKFGIDLYPWDGAKWELSFNCVKVPSGNGDKLRARFDDLIAQDGICNPESLAVEAVIHTALEGLLGTIRRCKVAGCGKWFLTKDDPRVRCCSDHNVDDLRKGTVERKKQVSEAAKRARKRAKTEDEEHWEQLHGKQSNKPGRHRV